jgi:protein-ribulosamine 3-kinase
MIPAFLASLKEEIIECRLIKSGRVADIWKLKLSSGCYCIKQYKDSSALLRQQAEMKDLSLLSELIPDAIPKMHKDLANHCDGHLICLDWIENNGPGNPSRSSAAELISALHQKNADYAGLHYDNFIGELTQYNSEATDWPSFWVSSRLLPQLNLAIENKFLQAGELKNLEKYISGITAYLPDLNSFSLLHGDLWNGNVLTDQMGRSFLIDPAVYYGDTWVDLAMTKLFGGFAPEFYDEYFERSNIDSKGEELIPHYQLYYLMVHLNMFGRSYYPDVARIVHRYV